MRRLAVIVAMIGLETALSAGFNPKVIKPKRPDKFQIAYTVSGVTFAADLLLSDKEQKAFFYKALNPTNIIPVRLAIFNDSKNEVLIPVDGIRLIGPDGKELPIVPPEAVAKAVLLDSEPGSKAEASPVKVVAGPKVAGSRTDKTNPNYDPRLDPTDPRYDPNDPRNAGRNRGYNEPGIIPGVDVILNPSGRSGDDEEIRGRLIEKDFVDKAYTSDPIPSSLMRDRFLYFSIGAPPKGINGFELHLPQGKGVSQDVILIF